MGVVVPEVGFSRDLTRRGFPRRGGGGGGGSLNLPPPKNFETANT